MISGTRLSRSGTRSTPITRQFPRCSAIRHAIEPIGPKAEHHKGAVVGHVGVLDGLPGGGQHVGQIDVALVGPVVGQEMLNGMTTRPTSSTTPIALWPRMSQAT